MKGSRLFDEGLMRPCPTCALPFEHGEKQCINCHAPLADEWQLESVARRSAARSRAGRIVLIVTPMLYLICILGLFGVRSALLDELTRTQWREFATGAPVIVLTGACLSLLGFPGRTLHHYPSYTIIRQGAPRWWKGALTSVVFAIAATVSIELISRPALESRIVRLITQTPQEAAVAIDTWVFASYVATGIMLLWMLVAPLLGPQEMGKRRRWHLMRMQNYQDARNPSSS